VTAPSAPTALIASAVSPNKISLSWSAPSNTGGYAITGYKIEVKSGSGSYSTLVTNTGNATTAYSHAGLTTGTTYTYKVSAINSVGTGTASNEASATPTTSSTATAPGSPTGLTATAASGTQINLSWQAPSNTGGSPITGYKIEYKVGSGSYAVLVANNLGTTYSHTGLTAGTQYSYRISAINSIGTGPASEVSATPKETTVPALTGLAVSPTQIDLSWSAPSQTYGQRISGFKIEEKTGTSFRVIADNVGAVLGYSITGLTIGKSHTYVVTALFPAGSSPRSNEVTVTPTNTSTTPSGYVPPSTKTLNAASTTKNNDLKSQQDLLKQKTEQAREELKKKLGKEDSAKAKAAREEAQKANEKAKQEAATKRKQILAEKQATLKAKQEKAPDQTIKQKPTNSTKQKPKTLEEARKLAEEAKQRALEKAKINTTKSTDDKKQKELDAAKAAAWEKARKALEELKAKSQK
jgi:titin